MNCMECGKKTDPYLFHNIKKERKFCSKKCCNSFHNKLNNSKRKELLRIIICPVCKKDFYTKFRRITCSDECKKIYMKNYMKKYDASAKRKESRSLYNKYKTSNVPLNVKISCALIKMGKRFYSERFNNLNDNQTLSKIINKILKGETYVAYK